MKEMIRNYNKIAIISSKDNISYQDLNNRIVFYSLYTPKQKNAKTIIISENRLGWVYAFFSIWYNHGIAVPVDASATIQDLAYILNDCHPEFIWTSKEKEQTVKDALKESGLDIPYLYIEDYEHASMEISENAASTDADDDFMVTRSNDIALIIYTSGTTGSPKGVMLSYTNLNANLIGVCEQVPIFNANRRTMVLLPVHHVLPLMGTIIAPILTGGGIIICPSMTGPDIMDCLCRGKVAIFVGVPRLWQTLYSGIKKKIDEKAVTRLLFNICRKVNSRALSRFVFQSVRNKMGGNIYCCVSGGAALDKEIGEGLRTLGLDVLEGYGMTETAPMISFTRPGDIIPGCAGLPLPSMECKIVNGELLAKGPNVMLGYYNRPEETAEVIDKDGFIHTGDLARMDERGRIYITGRSKEIIVLSNGKNVQPNEIEFKLEKYDDKVKEAAVVQDGDMLRAIIVPQEAWAISLTDSEVEAALKKEVIEPYNLSVANYKKLMSIFVYRNALPRTKLDKLQRYKLKAIIENAHKKSESNAKDSDYAKADNLEAEYKVISEYIEQEKKITIKPDDHIETDLAFDSLDKVGLQSFIESTFGMEVTQDKLISLGNVKEIAQYIHKQKTKMEVGETDWKAILSADNKSLNLPKTSPFYTFYAKAFKGFFKLYNRLSVKGIENIPANGPFIIAPNHQSFLDGPLAVTGMNCKTIRDCYFYATEEHVKGTATKYLAQHNNIILMERRNLKNSILKLSEVLKEGKNIVIFPEGSRTHTGKLSAFKKTFAILSKEINVPIVPVCIKGAFEANPRGKKTYKPHPISVEYLSPIEPATTDTYDSLTAKVKAAISSCLEK